MKWLSPLLLFFLCITPALATPTMTWTDWNPNNQTCNAKVAISGGNNSTQWNITIYNVSTGNAYRLLYAENQTIVGNASPTDGGQASIIAIGITNGTYWIAESYNGFTYMHFVVGIAFVGSACVLAINTFSKRRKKN